MDTSFIKGGIIPPPIVTPPITEDEKVDEASLRHLVDYVIEGGDAPVSWPSGRTASST